MTPEEQAIREKREALREIEEQARAERALKMRSRRRSPPAAQIIPFMWWAILLTLGAALMYGIYVVVVFFAILAPCGGDTFFGSSYAHGGPSKTVVTAGVIDAALWFAAGIAGWRFPRRHGVVFLAFAALYVVALMVLWGIAPAIWGEGVCA
jgi:hypothetical protein